MTPSCPRFPETNDDSNGQASVDHDHRVELLISLQYGRAGKQRKGEMYMSVGVRSDKLLVSDHHHLLCMAAYEGDIVVVANIDYDLPRDNTSKISKPMTIVSHDHYHSSGKRLT
jgi:hypothetical protein